MPPVRIYKYVGRSDVVVAAGSSRAIAVAGMQPAGQQSAYGGRRPVVLCIREGHADWPSITIGRRFQEPLASRT